MRQTSHIRLWRTLLPISSVVVLAACSGGSPTTPVTGTDSSNPTCTGTCLSTSTSNLSVADVQRVIAQGVAEAQARGTNATIAVVDRVGNVLAVYRMGDPTTRSVTVTTSPDGSVPISGGLEGIRLPVQAAMVNIDQAAAIAKAVTGAYLSSEGNAFSTRVASQIVQEHFNPGELRQPAGPLFGVQWRTGPRTAANSAGTIGRPRRFPAVQERHGRGGCRRVG
jgi:hypothetical protein